ncbi:MULTISPECIES: hypothetical protein [unclassified Streptomyces]|uniref:hypothetical protein n=1 Tax=unclassified Streptomyces TaxID=2593676 RepID=UPI002E338385|nr:MULTISPECIES: hypothetical protein [unclassified Streptomyces]WUC68033.1 hypothetical protein OG861_29465 [Streptomyces sp. NBC_00539]
MRTRTRHRALVSVLAASALTALVPATATPAAAAPPACSGRKSGVLATIYPGQRLEPGARLVDKVSTTELVMQPDGNLVLYALGNPGGYRLPLWNSGTYGNPGAYATMQDDGNFVIYRQGGSPQTGGGIWHTATYGSGTGSVEASLMGGEFLVEGRSNQHWTTRSSERQAWFCSEYATAAEGWWTGNWAQSATVWLVLQQDNNLVMYRKSDGKAIWYSGTYGGGYRVTLQMAPKDRGDLTLVEEGRGTVRWRTGTANNDGAYALLQDDGNFVVYKKDGGPGKGGGIWATGTYNKI